MKKFLLMKQAPSVTQIASPFSKPLLYVLYCIGREYAHLQNEVFGLLQYSCYLFKNFTNKPHESQFTTSKSQSTCCDQEARLSLSLSLSLSLAMPVHHTLYILFVAAAGKFGDLPTCLSRVALTNMSP
jgi:hypothetical protein